MLIKQLDKNNSTDVSTCVALIDTYARDPMGGSQGLSAATQSSLPQRIMQHPTTFAFLAYIDETAVGILFGYEGLSSFYAAPIIHVHDLAVLPTHRNKGIAGALLIAAEKYALTCQACRLVLEVREDNHIAKNLYLNHGYQKAGLADSPYLLLQKSL